MASFDEFAPFVTDECSGAPDPAVDRAVRLSCMEFCRESLIHVVSHDDIALLANVKDYEIALDDKYQMVFLRAAWFNDTPLYVPAEDEVYRTSQRYSGLAASDQPIAAYILSPGTIRVIPAPLTSAGNKLRLDMAAAPSLDSDEFPDDLFNRYFDAIAAGAKARLQVQPGKPWSTEKAATVNRGLFLSALNSARVTANERMSGEMRIALRPAA